MWQRSPASAGRISTGLFCFQTAVQIGVVRARARCGLLVWCVGCVYVPVCVPACLKWLAGEAVEDVGEAGVEKEK